MNKFFVSDESKLWRFLRERLFALLPSFLGAGASVALIAVVAFAATTINENISTGGTLTVSGNTGIGTTSPWGLLSVNPNGITGPAFVIGSSTATNFVVTNGGNVGIGTASPGAQLHIKDGSGIWIQAVNASMKFSDAYLTASLRMNTGNLEILDNTNSPTVHFSNIDGNVGIGTTSPATRTSISSSATTTLFLDSTTIGNGTCIQMRTAGTLDRWAKLFIDDGGNLKSELGSC